MSPNIYIHYRKGIYTFQQMSVYSTKIDIFESLSSSLSNKNDVEKMNKVGRFASQFLVFPHDNERMRALIVTHAKEPPSRKASIKAAQKEI